MKKSLILGFILITLIGSMVFVSAQESDSLGDETKNKWAYFKDKIFSNLNGFYEKMRAGAGKVFDAITYSKSKSSSSSSSPSSSSGTAHSQLQKIGSSGW